jgi:diguanylate cyclase (GGDEF)-like protein
MRNKLWKIWLIGGAVTIALYYTILPKISHAIEIVYFAVGFATVFAIVVGIRIHRPQRAWAWYLLAAAMALWVIGDGIYNALVILHPTYSYPTLADPFFLLAYPLFGIALILMRKKRARGSRSGVMVEAAIITFAASLVSWILLMRPYLEDPTATLMAKVVSIAYPIGDLFLLGVIIPMIGGVARRSMSSRFLMTWVTLLLGSDAIYSIMVIHGSYVFGSWIDSGWMFGYVLLGAAALHPSINGSGGESEEAETHRSIGRVRLALLAVATLSAPAVIVIEAVERDWNDVMITALGSCILGFLILIRLTSLVREADARRRELDEALEQISFQALHDPLTGLANRSLFSDRIEHASARVQRLESTFAVLLLDLDDFKAINDGMGHAVGDELLREVAARLQAATRASDTVARLGGDEFAVLIEDLEGGGRAHRVAERILLELEAPILVGGRNVFQNASVGIALLDKTMEASDTLRQADIAMYSAKRVGKGRFVQFAAGMGVGPDEVESAERRRSLAEVLTLTASLTT